MATPKRTRRHRQADMIFVERWWIQGVSQSEIAERLSAERPYSLSRRQIRYDIDEILAKWAEVMLEEREKHIVEQLKKLSRVEAEAWAAWEASKEPLEKLSTKKVKIDGDAGSTRTEAGKVLEGRDGNVRFLELVRQCVDQRARLLNLYGDGRFPFREQAQGITSLEDLVSAAVTYAQEDRMIEMIKAPSGDNGNNGRGNGHQEEHEDEQMDKGTGGAS